MKNCANAEAEVCQNDLTRVVGQRPTGLTADAAGPGFAPWDGSAQTLLVFSVTFLYDADCDYSRWQEHRYRCRSTSYSLFFPMAAWPAQLCSTSNATNSARPERGTQKFARYRRRRSGRRKTSSGPSSSDTTARPGSGSTCPRYSRPPVG
jgi:hypothetical protein